MNVIYYGIDEAMFLALRLLMIIKGSAANIIEVLDIPFACPRVRARTGESSAITNYATAPYACSTSAHEDVK